MPRDILHCDLNNFYASVECMLDPSLRNHPVAVCGSVEERHGIVLAKNYAAKAYDVRTGDAVWQAKQKCHDKEGYHGVCEKICHRGSISYARRQNNSEVPGDR